MSRRFLVFILVGWWAVLGVPEPVAAAGDNELEYDIFKRDGHITVWLNLSPLLTSYRLKKLKEGINFSIEYRLNLVTPKRLWGTTQVAQKSGTIKIGYRLVTENYFLTTPVGDSSVTRHFISLAQFHHYLGDSVLVEIASVDSLDAHKRYALKLNVSCISLVGINLAAQDGRENEDSPLKYLFRQFLRLTNFGREEYTAESRPLSLSELTTEN